MEKFLLIIHSISALIVIGLILLQQGKGAATGASFGSGASQTVFGSDGSGSFFTRATAIFATIFFVACITKAYIAKSNSKAPEQIVPVATQPATTEVNLAPAVPATPSAQAPATPSASTPAAEAPKAASDVPATPPAK